MYMEIDDNDDLRISDLGERFVSIEDENENELVLVRDRDSGKLKLFVQNPLEADDLRISDKDEEDTPVFYVDMKSRRIIEEE